MSKKDYKLMSNKRCVKCGKPIKQNVIDRQPTAKYCYKHYMEIKRGKQNSYEK